MSIKLYGSLIPKSRKAMRAIRPGSAGYARLYVLAAFAIALVSATAVVMLEHYSDVEGNIEMSLSRIQASAYQLATIEERAHADAQFDARSRREDESVDAEITKEIGAIHSMGDSRPAAKIKQTFVKLDANLGVEYKAINAGRPNDAEVYAVTNVDPLFATLNHQVENLSTTAHAGADRANLIAILGSILLILLTGLIVSSLFRRYVGSKLSIAELATKQATLLESESRFRALLSNASDLILIISPGAAIRFVASAAVRVWAHGPDELQNTSMLSLVHGEDVADARELLNTICLSSDSIVHGELRIRHGDGSYRPSEVVLINLIGEEGIDGIVVNCRDISERKFAEAKISHQAFHDPLTDLPNRTLFMERLAHALDRSQRSHDQIAVIFLDIDNFKVVNDSLGHEAGDTLLKVVADRLSSLVRVGDTVARLGGDEFTILLEDVKSDLEIMAVSERIADILHTSITIDRREVFATASLGIAVSHGNYTAAEDLLRDADTAMYQAKSTAKGHSVVFDTNMNTRAVERLELEIDLHTALERDELRVYYQPIVSLDSDTISEVEALVRWQHPTRGLIPPSAFIPIAEESGLIVPLGSWILETACTQVMEWQRSYSQAKPLTVSVNLSVRQLQEPNLVPIVKGILERVGLNPTNLKLEITESVMSRDPASMSAKLDELKAVGIRISIDDFGTGYSSMSYLSGLPLDTLKIDRSFVSKIGHSDEDDAIVRAIVTLAKALSLRTTAEGIETFEQLKKLKALHCDQGQGYLYSRPVSARDMSVIFASVGTSGHMLGTEEIELPRAA